MGKIWDSIDKQVIRPRTIESHDKGFLCTQEDISSFYDSEKKPTNYKRKYIYKNSPETTDVIAAGNGYKYTISLYNPGYPTGTPGFPVFEEAQYNGSGILGNPDTWEDAVNDIKFALINSFIK